MTNFVRRPRGRMNPRNNGRRQGSNFRNNGSSQVISINDNGNSNGSFQRQRNNNHRNSGNVLKLVEKYKTLANDALASGDRVLAENYFQHADHFIRLLPEQKSVIPQEKSEIDFEENKSEPNLDEDNVDTKLNSNETEEDSEKLSLDSSSN